MATNLGLFQFDIDEFLLKRVKVQDYKSSLLLEKNILSILVDSQSNIWLGTVSSGVLKIQSNNSNYLSLKQIPLTNKRILALEEYGSDKIFCGTENDGLFVFRLPRILQIGIFQIILRVLVLPPTLFGRFFQITNRGLWIGYYDKGLDKYDPKHFKFNFFENKNSAGNSIIPKSISGIAKDKNGLIWFSSIDQGVYAYNSNKDYYYHLNDPKNKLASGINSYDIPSLYIDKQGNVWVASWYSGIYLLKNGTDRFVNFNRKTHPEIFKSNRIASFSRI